MIKVKQQEFKIAMAIKGFTGAELSRATGISQSYIAQIISGKRSVLATTSSKICKALQSEFDDIFIIGGET